MKLHVHTGSVSVYTRDLGGEYRCILSKDADVQPATIDNPLYDADLAEKLGEKYWFEYEPAHFRDLPNSDIDLRSLASAQKSLYSPRLYSLKMAKSEDLQPIYVVQREGKNVVWDGNHRVLNAIERGDETIKAKILNGIERVQQAALDGAFIHSRTWRKPQEKKDGQADSHSCSCGGNH